MNQQLIFDIAVKHKHICGELPLNVVEELTLVGFERFAEAIVKECMAEIQKVKEIKAGHAGPEYTQGFDDGMFVAISTIEEHFGVEE